MAVVALVVTVNMLLLPLILILWLMNLRQPDVALLSALCYLSAFAGIAYYVYRPSAKWEDILPLRASAFCYLVGLAASLIGIFWHYLF